MSGGSIRRLAAAVAILVALAAVSLAQQNSAPSAAPAAAAAAQSPAAGGATPAAASTAEAPMGDAAARPPLNVELEPSGGFSYNPQGRRDPFVSLLRPVVADRGPKTRKPGMEGFMIQEVVLRGVVKTDGGGVGSAQRPGFIAVVLGADGRSYFVTEGQRLFDGSIVRVDAASVTFRQEVDDPLSPVKTRDVRKSLYASEEARQ